MTTVTTVTKIKHILLIWIVLILSPVFSMAADSPLKCMDENNKRLVELLPPSETAKRLSGETTHFATVFNTRGCSMEKIHEDIKRYQLYMTENKNILETYSLRSPVNFEKVLEVVKTDHSEDGGSYAFYDDELSALNNFYKGSKASPELFILDYADKDPLGEDVYTSVLILLFTQDKSELILIVKPTTNFQPW